MLHLVYTQTYNYIMFELHNCIFHSFWQYGFVNHALELLVLRNYGPDVWEDIK